MPRLYGTKILLILSRLTYEGAFDVGPGEQSIPCDLCMKKAMGANIICRHIEAVTKWPLRVNSFLEHDNTYAQDSKRSKDKLQYSLCASQVIFVPYTS